MGNYERNNELGSGAQASRAIEFGGIIDVVYLTFLLVDQWFQESGSLTIWDVASFAIEAGPGD